MRGSRVVPAIVVALLSGAAAAASATVHTGASDDPRQADIVASRDIERVAARFDEDAGEWSLTVRLFGRLTAGSAATLRAFLRLRDSSGGCAHRTSAMFVGSTDPRSGSGVGGAYTDDEPPTGDRRSAKAFSPDRREMTLWLRDPRLVHREPCSVDGVRLSRGEVYDTVPPLAMAMGARLADASRPVAGLRFAAGGPRLALGQHVRGIVLNASEPASASIELRWHRVRLGLARYNLSPGRPRTITVRLSRRGARTLRSARSAKVAVRARLVDDVGNQSLIERHVRVRR